MSKFDLWRRVWRTGLLLACTGMAAAQPWTEERVWTGANGQEMRARLAEVNADGKVRLATTTGQNIEVPVERLAREDRIFAFRYATQRLRRVVPPTVKAAELTAADRLSVPSFDQSQFGSRDADCVPNAFANFVFWWHDHGVLALKAPAERARMVQNAHTQLARLCRTSNSAGTGLVELISGAQSYIAAEQNELALQGEARSFTSLTELQRAIRPDMAVVLGVRLRRGAALDPRGHAVSLVAFDAPSLTSTLHTWGERMSGQWVKVVIQNQVWYQFVLSQDPARAERRPVREGAFVIKADAIEAALLELVPAARAAP